jgi:hypothetical protein
MLQPISSGLGRHPLVVVVFGIEREFRLLGLTAVDERHRRVTGLLVDRAAVDRSDRRPDPNVHTQVLVHGSTNASDQRFPVFERPSGELPVVTDLRHDHVVVRSKEDRLLCDLSDVRPGGLGQTLAYAGCLQSSSGSAWISRLLVPRPSPGAATGDRVGYDRSRVPRSLISRMFFTFR